MVSKFVVLYTKDCQWQGERERERERSVSRRAGVGRQSWFHGDFFKHASPSAIRRLAR